MNSILHLVRISRTFICVRTCTTNGRLSVRLFNNSKFLPKMAVIFCYLGEYTMQLI